MSQANTSAFPLDTRKDYPGEFSTGTIYHGLTKRELFAAMMFPTAQKEHWEQEMPYTTEDIARAAVMQADALIAALEEGK